MSAMLILPWRRATEAKYVARVAPHSASTTLMAVKGISSGATRAAQKLGQKTHSTMLPSIENRSLVASHSIFSENSRGVVIVRMTPRPKRAPKAWMTIEPPVSAKPAGDQAQPALEHDPFIEHVADDEEDAQHQVLPHLQSAEHRAGADQQTGRPELRQDELVDLDGLRLAEDAQAVDQEIDRDRHAHEQVRRRHGRAPVLLHEHHQEPEAHQQHGHDMDAAVVLLDVLQGRDLSDGGRRRGLDAGAARGGVRGPQRLRRHECDRDPKDRAQPDRSHLHCCSVPTRCFCPNAESDAAIRVAGTHMRQSHCRAGRRKVPKE